MDSSAFFWLQIVQLILVTDSSAFLVTDSLVFLVTDSSVFLVTDSLAFTSGKSTNLFWITTPSSPMFTFSHLPPVPLVPLVSLVSLVPLVSPVSHSPVRLQHFQHLILLYIPKRDF